MNGRTIVTGSPFELVQDQEGNIEHQLRRCTRERYMPAKFFDYELLFTKEEDHSLLVLEFLESTMFKSFLRDSNNDKWQVAMHEEMDSLIENQTWDFVTLPQNWRPLKNKCIYQLKEEKEISLFFWRKGVIWYVWSATI